MTTTQIWDPFVRAGHWLLVAGFTVAYLTGEEWGAVHVYAGYLVLGVLLFRIAWGFIGTGPARFRNFVRPFAAVKAHLRDLAHLEAPPYPGHNPAGGWMVMLMLATLTLLSLSGLLLLGAEGAGPFAHTAAAGVLGEEAWEEVHEVLANLAVLLVVIHLGGVVMESMLTGENLPRAMVTGIKRVDREGVKG